MQVWAGRTWPDGRVYEVKNWRLNDTATVGSFSCKVRVALSLLTSTWGIESLRLFHEAGEFGEFGRYLFG